MISLRLSEEEYEALRNVYRVHGSRSVSEFARNAMQEAIDGGASAVASTFETRILNLDSKMASLDQEVGRLVQLIHSRQELAGTPVTDSKLAVGAA